ncbi:MAG: transglycosylase SLT domain-containing protein [bacterium]
MEIVLNIVTLFGVGLASLALCIVAVRALDRLIFPNMDFEKQLISGNVAVGIFLAALVLGIFMLMGRATAAPLDHYEDHYRKWARYHFGYQYDWQIFKAQGMTESGLNPRICSTVGACGVMQFMPSTANAMGLTDRFDARASIEAGLGYMRALWSLPQVKQSIALAFISYNAGPHRLKWFQHKARWAGHDPFTFEGLKPHLWKEPRGYVERIRRWCERFGGLKCSAG